jgi:hypothetical protein
MHLMCCAACRHSILELPHRSTNVSKPWRRRGSAWRIWSVWSKTTTSS